MKKYLRHLLGALGGGVALLVLGQLYSRIGGT